MKPIIPSLDSRLNYLTAYRKLKGLGIKVNEDGQHMLTQSFLRTEVKLNINKTAYQFGILDNQNVAGVAAYPTEQRLKLQDVFFVSHIGYYLNLQSTPGGKTDYQYVLQTFPSTWPLGAAGYNLDLLRELWTAATLSLNVNNKVITPGWDLFRHHEIPETQYPAYAQVPAQYNYFDQIDGSQSGLYPVEPNWMLNGAYNNELFINLAQAPVNAGLGANTDARLVIIFRGVLAQNCSNILIPS